MFSFKSFVESIQGAVLGANDALMSKNLEVLNQYFEKDDDDGEIQKKIDEALSATDAVVNPSSKISRQDLDHALRSIKELKSTLSQPDAEEQAMAQGDLRPKTVILNYPTTAPDGSIANKEVHVPLITLVPVEFSKVEEVRLKADLELSLVNDELQVGLGKFSNRPKNTEQESEASKKGSVGNVEIVLKPQQMSDGLQHVVDSYEKILKAQLPN
ncbi:DUF2589 domain-containing protein [Reichenbachiella sp.]|uniref:DUF2589 domain-containing protein n=1 Tax=Reichenbachiella sp. TaxID=2184521 RepID=UPI003BAE6013